MVADWADALTATVAHWKIGVLRAQQCSVQTNSVSEIAFSPCVLRGSPYRALPIASSRLMGKPAGALPWILWEQAEVNSECFSKVALCYTMGRFDGLGLPHKDI